MFCDLVASTLSQNTIKLPAKECHFKQGCRPSARNLDYQNPTSALHVQVGPIKVKVVPFLSF